MSAGSGGRGSRSQRRLLRRVRRGDAAALAELLDRLRPGVMRAIRRQLPASLRAEVDSDDFWQETCKAVLGGPLPEQVATPELFRRRVGRIGRNKVLDAIKRARVPTVTLDSPDGPTAPVKERIVAIALSRGRSGRATFGSRMLERLMERKVVRACSDKLGELEFERRFVFALKNGTGLSWREIADLAGRPTANAAQMLYQRTVRDVRGKFAPGVVRELGDLVAS